MSVAGTISGKAYSIGDWMVYNGTSWDRVDNEDPIVVFNGRTGYTITMQESDVTDLIGSYTEFVTEFETGLSSGAT